MRKLVRRQIDAGINFLVPCGTTGESPTLTQDEHLRVVEIAVEEAKGKVPVLAGAGGYNTHEVIEIAREIEKLGADGLLSVTPYYNKPSQEGLYQHFKAIADAVPLPIILYNIKGRTSVNITAPTMQRLAGIENVVGVKEASGDLGQIVQVLKDSSGDDFDVLSGDDGVTTIPMIALGGKGVISVASNEIPAEMTAITQAALAGDFVKARQLHEQWYDLMTVNFVDVNPVPVKAAMAMMGLLEPVYRLPLVPASEASARGDPQRVERRWTIARGGDPFLSLVPEARRHFKT